MAHDGVVVADFEPARRRPLRRLDFVPWSEVAFRESPESEFSTVEISGWEFTAQTRDVENVIHARNRALQGPHAD